MIDISIIIPIYNCQDLIQSTVENIFSQKCDCTYEVILIDDGSKDNTLKICMELIKRYDRLSVFSQSNAGPSAARNKGVEKAKGKYLIFIDADDLPEAHMISVLYGLMKQNAELGIASYYIEIQDGIKTNVEEILCLNNNIDISKVNFGEICCEWYSNHLLTPIWNKIYRKDIIDKFQIRFRENLSISEDLLWNIDYITYINRIVTSNEIVYRYIIRKKRSTITHGYNDKHVNMQIIVASEMIHFLNNKRSMNDGIYYLNLKYITSSLSNIYLERGLQNKSSVIKNVMNNIIVQKMASHALERGFVSKVIIRAYSKKKLWLLKLILRGLCFSKKYLYAFRRRVMKVISN